MRAARGWAPAQRFPVAIGGIGGSGTRIGAALLHSVGYYIGDDLNGALDNLWFTLLFKRRSVLLEEAGDFAQLAALFFARMAGEAIPERANAVLARLVDERIQHDGAWLEARARSFARAGSRHGRPWGWKEPNTHVLIDRLLAFDGALRYIHFVRHPLDMALSSNMHQLENWGPVFLDRDVEPSPRDALAYWCAAHRRVAQSIARAPARCMMVDYDALCADPERGFARIAMFLNIPPGGEPFANLLDAVHPPPSSGRFRNVPREQFARHDLTYVASLGYAVEDDARAAAASADA